MSFVPVEMNIEENRLKTFKDWPTNAPVDAARIAKAGFYYTGIALEVQCFLCGVRIGDWNYSDQAMARHRLADHTCPFVLNSSSTCNVPLLQLMVNNVTTGGQQSSSSLSTGQSNDVESGSDITYERPVTRNPIDPLKEYGTISQRLQSFDNWPIPSIISPERLAKAGFYYLQCRDMVECVFCKGVIMKWEAGDDPDREHRLHFPSCNFYMKQETEDEGFEFANVKLLPGQEADLAELGIQIHKTPNDPEHATYEGRLQTFQGWPVDITQTPETLSNAGFYYTGYGDQVRCFSCDGGLRSWESTDNVWVEHARWFPKCAFVRLVCGPEFIKYCADNRPPLDPSIFAGVPEEENENLDSPSASISTVSNVTKTEKDKAVEKLLDTASAMAALEIGLHVDEVKKALKKRLEAVGTSYACAAELIEDILHDQAGNATSLNRNISNAPSAELSNLLKPIVTAQLHDNKDVCSELNKDRDNKTCGSSTEETDMNDEKTQFKGQKTSNKFDDTISLQEENRRLKEARLCKICMDHELAVVFLPCGHLATCVLCAPSLAYCPMCRVKIRANVRIFLS